MAIHFCMTYPCPVCTTTWTSAQPSRVSITSSWGIPVRQRFYTWREAILTALRTKSTNKPTVAQDLTGMWVVTTYQIPVAYNNQGAVA